MWLCAAASKLLTTKAFCAQISSSISHQHRRNFSHTAITLSFLVPVQTEHAGASGHLLTGMRFSSRFQSEKPAVWTTSPARTAATRPSSRAATPPPPCTTTARNNMRALATATAAAATKSVFQGHCQQLHGARRRRRQQQQQHM